MSRTTHRKSPSGETLNNLTLYDKDGVAYQVDGLQVTAIKVGEDGDVGTIDGRAQYYTKGVQKTFSPSTPDFLDLCKAAEGVNGNTIVFDVSNLIEAGQLVLMGARVTIAQATTGIAPAIELIAIDDLVFGIYKTSSGYLLTDTQGTKGTSSLSLSGSDSSGLGASYSLSVTGSGFAITFTPPATADRTWEVFTDLFAYETKTVVL